MYSCHLVFDIKMLRVTDAELSFCVAWEYMIEWGIGQTSVELYKCFIAPLADLQCYFWMPI